MGKIGLAFRAFFRILSNQRVAAEVESLLSNAALPPDHIAATPAPAAEPRAKTPPPAGRSEALTLLATLQREARLLDLVQEPLAAYEDAQVGAAARDVLRNCHGVLERMFALVPVLEDEEQATVEVPAGYSPARYRLTGNLHGEPPFRGTLQHRGWRATRCQLPDWSGDAEGALILAPAEVELK